MEPAAQYALAYALTTTAGLRGFLTLLAASIAAHFGWIHPSAGYAWLGSDKTIVVLAVFAAIELLADKVPLVDHAMHVVYFAVRPVTAAILVGATVAPVNHGAVVGMMVAGGLNALIVHGSAATARAASTATTFGAGNVALSFFEDATAAGGIVLAFAKPLVAGVLALFFVLMLVLFARAVTRRVRRVVPRRER